MCAAVTSVCTDTRRGCRTAAVPGTWCAPSGRNVLVHCWALSELRSADERRLSLGKRYCWTRVPVPLGLSVPTGTASLFGIENSNSLILRVEQCDIISRSNDNLFTEYQLVFGFLREQRWGMESRLDDTT